MPPSFSKNLQLSMASGIERYYGGGEILFVGNRAGLPAGDGSTPFYPLSNLPLAVSKLQGQTNRGHVIFVLPGSAFNVDTADWLALQGAADTFAIVGLGRGNARPTLTWTTALSSILMDTPNMAIDNCRLFMAGAHAAGAALTVAAPITITAAGCFINNCEGWWGFDADQIVNIGITTTAGATNLTINDCRFFAETAAVPTATFLRLTGTNQLEINNTQIIGPGSTIAVGPVQMLTTPSLKAKITNSRFQSTTASGTIAFTAIAGCTGIVDACGFGVLASGNGITTGSGLQVTGSFTAIAGAAGVATTG